MTENEIPSSSHGNEGGHTDTNETDVSLPKQRKRGRKDATMDEGGKNVRSDSDEFKFGRTNVSSSPEASCSICLGKVNIYTH